MYAGGSSFSAEDCMRAAMRQTPVVPVKKPKDPDSKGHSIGKAVGCTALFEEVGTSVFSYGSFHVTKFDCLQGVIDLEL